MLPMIQTRGPLLVALLGLPLAAQEVRLRDALPQGTIFYVAAPDLKASLAEVMTMPLLRMWGEAEVQDFFADALKMLDAEWSKGLDKARTAHKEGVIPFDPDELLKLRVHGAGFALTSLDMSIADGEPMPHVGIVLHLDFGDTAPAWRQVIEYGLQMALARSGGELSKEESKVGDLTLVTLVPPETDMSLNVAFVGNSVLIGSVKSEMQQLLESVTAGKKGLSTADAFVATFKNLDTSGAEVEGYLQLGPALDFVNKALRLASENAPDFPAEIDVAGVGRALDALGLRSIKATGFTSTFQPNAGSQGNKSVSKGFVYAPAPERRGLLAGSNKDLDLGFLKWVPKDVASFSASTFDLASIWEALVGALKAYDEEKAGQLLGMLGMYEQQFGINVKEDLIGALGNEFILWSMPVAALGTTPEMAFLVQIKDQEKLLKTLRTVAKLSDGAFELDESERQGVTVYQIQINVDPTGGMGFNPLDMFTPTFAFKNGYLVAGFTTGDVKRVFKRMDEENATNDVRSNAEFKAYMEALPQQGLSSISFSDWKANFEGMYQLVTSLAAFIPVDEDIPIDLSLLPDVATLTKHLFGSVSWSTSDGSGYHTYSQGPWGPETIAVIGGAAGVGAAVLVGRPGRIRIR